MAIKSREGITPELAVETDGGTKVIQCRRVIPGHPHIGRRLLFRYDENEVLLFCKWCKMHHPIEWDALLALRLALDAEEGTEEANGETNR